MEKLKRLREERGLSQVKLAARADLNPATVNQIERGMRDASPGTLRKLAGALEVSLYELMEEEAPKVEAPPSPEPPSDEGSGRRRRASLPNFKDFLEKEAGSFYLALPHDLIRQLWEQADTPATRWRLYEQIRREHAAVVKLADEKRDQLGEVQRIKLDDVWLRQANTRMVEATERVRQKTDA